MRIENYNSAYQLTQEQINYALGHLGFLASTAVHVPIYLVNEKTIDEIYPPEKLKDFNEGCLKEIFFMYEKEKQVLNERLKSYGKTRNKLSEERSYEDSREEVRESEEYENTTEKRFKDRIHRKTINDIEKNLYNQIEECVTDRQTEFQAIGLYLKEPELDGIPYKPVILICLEKIEKISDEYIQNNLYAPNSKSENVMILFTAVLLHELTHAYLKTDERITQKTSGRVIEETPCNATAFEHFDNWKEKSFLMRFHSEQPIVYRGYTFW